MHVDTCRTTPRGEPWRRPQPAAGSRDRVFSTFSAATPPSAAPASSSSGSSTEDTSASSAATFATAAGPAVARSGYRASFSADEFAANATLTAKCVQICVQVSLLHIATLKLSLCECHLLFGTLPQERNLRSAAKEVAEK